MSAPMSLPALPAPPSTLSSIEKAAVIYGLLRSQGSAPPLEAFDAPTRAALELAMQKVGSLGAGDVSYVVDEFLGSLKVPQQPVSVQNQSNLNGEISSLGGETADVVPDNAGAPAESDGLDDAWKQIVALENEALLAILRAEAAEVGAVIMSKLKVSRAAELLGGLPGPQSRRIAYAVSLTSEVAPDVVSRIGEALAETIDDNVQTAFDDGPVERVGAILNSSRAATRNDVLEGLDETDPEFAEAVRRSIFTFANIPGRVDKRDVPKIIRGVDQSELVKAIAGAQDEEDLKLAADFVLEALPQRMRDTLASEIEEIGELREDETEGAMAQVVGAIRALEEAGEIYLISEE